MLGGARQLPVCVCLTSLPESSSCSLFVDGRACFLGAIDAMLDITCRCFRTRFAIRWRPQGQVQGRAQHNETAGTTSLAPGLSSAPRRSACYRRASLITTGSSSRGDGLSAAGGRRSLPLLYFFSVEGWWRPPDTTTDNNERGARRGASTRSDEGK